MSSWQDHYLDKFYQNQINWKHPYEMWRELLVKSIPSNARVLDVGAGDSNHSSEYLSEIAGHLVGLDIEPTIKNNKFLNEFHVYDGKLFPFPDNCYDAVVSNWVNEHLPDPENHCGEIYRVLAPGGVYIFCTPNLHHYISWIAHITPHWFHQLVANPLRRFPISYHDPWPTYYRFNTRNRCTFLLREIGFDIEVFRLIETYPEYGQSSKILFFLFMAYERLVNSTNHLENFRHMIHCVARKQPSLP